MSRSADLADHSLPNHERLKGPWATSTVVACLLVIHVGLVGRLAFLYSPTIDEIAHLPAGVAVWELGRFDLYRVNPPLVKSIAAIPVLSAGARTDWSSLGDTTFLRVESIVGRDFLHANGNRAYWLWTLGRWACIPLSLIGAVTCYRWAQELYGSGPGLLALSLWCFSPSILAYSALIVPDLAAAATGVLVARRFRIWLARQDLVSAVWVGCAVALAQLSKLTWVIFLFILPAIWAVVVLHHWHARERLPSAAQLMLSLAISLYCVNLAYAFEGTGGRLGDYVFYSALLNGTETGAPGNRFWGTWCEHILVPFPVDYVTGCDLQKVDFERGLWSYMHGEHKHGGWWYFYVYGIAIKEPLGTLLLAAGGVCLWTCSRATRLSLVDAACLLVPPVSLIVFVSAETGFTRYVRYVLPVLPFVYILAARTLACPRRKCVAFASVAVLVYVAVSSICCFPFCFSYCNELVGGPRCGHYYLYGENLDSGQDLRFLREWSDTNPRARPLIVTLFPGTDLSAAGFNTDVVKLRDEDAPLASGWHAVSVTMLQRDSRKRRNFEGIEPVGRVGYSIYIFRFP